MNKTICVDSILYDYLLKVSLRENKVQTELRNVTARLERGRMQISPDQGQFMGLLVKMTGAKRILEIGAFTGYSALCMAQSLPEDGKLIACDLSSEWTGIAEKFWCDAGVKHKIELRVGPALETIESLLVNKCAETFDIIFIDADKINQLEYYQQGLRLLRKGGVMLIDNVLWGGSVIDKSDQSSDTNAIRELNNYLYTDDRVDISMLPVGDGLTLALKL